MEMAAYNCAGEGQTAMVTFRTGKGQSLPQLGVPMGLKKSSQAQVRPPPPCPTAHPLPVPASCGVCVQAKAPPLSRSATSQPLCASQAERRSDPTSTVLHYLHLLVGQKALYGEGDLILCALSLAELNPFLPRTAAQT